MLEFGPSLERKLQAARLVLILERAALALFWPLMWLGVLVLLLLFGVPQNASNGARIGFWLVALVSLGVAVWPSRQFRWPAASEVTQRVERESGFAFRPLMAMRDKLVLGEARLWAAHQARMAQIGARARYPRFRVSYSGLDPFALRNGLMLALVAAFVLKSPQALFPLTAALPQFASFSASQQIYGWITPPAYTGKPPVLLAQGSVIVSQSPLRVPEGSVVVLRMRDDSRAKLSLEASGVDTSIAFSRGEAKMPLQQTGSVVVRQGWRELGRWRIETIPDQKPEVRLSGPVEITAAGGISAAYEARDDYGFASLGLRFALSDMQDDGEGIAGTGALMAQAPQLDAALGGSHQGRLRGRLSGDLTRHAWAGLQVEAWMEARDGARHVARSQRVTLRLPERKFLNPLSQAVAEQRKQLLRDPENQPPVVAALDALSLWPKGLLDDSGRYLQLKAITRKLYRATSFGSIMDVAEELWQFALALEGGDLTGAKLGLEAARKALEEALARGADEEEIAKLVEALKQAMDKYLTALADAAKRGALAQKPSGKPQQLVRPEDLGRMLDQMQELARKGAGDQALDMLAQLDQILKNLQMGQAGQAQSQSGMLREFGKLTREQQLLMDRTFQLPEGEPDSGLQGEGGALAQQQDQLGQGLRAFMDQLGEQGLQVPDALGRAQKGMEDAGKTLRSERRNEALANQQQALNALREGFDQLNREMMGEGQGEPQAQAQEGEPNGQTDPLGRPRAARGPEYGSNENIVPGDAAAQSVKGILEELRGRSSSPTLKPSERDYIERLLRGLY